jgi:thioesterase domain-containing protein
MLVPYQTSGTKPPLFFVHGLRGIMFAVGSRFARSLRPDQPVYVVNSNGLDGRQPPEHVSEMVAAYLDEIRKVRPSGPLRIGGMCAGGFVAIELVRALQDEGRQTGPVLLVDPPVIPAGYEKRQNTTDIRPDLSGRLYQEVRSRYLEKTADPDEYDDLPFDPHDPKQLHLATLVAMRTMVAFAKYVPRPFSGATEVIVSENRAPGFLHPQMPWHKLLSGPRLVHIVPGHHSEIFRARRQTVARVMRSMLEEDPTSENLSKGQIRPAAALIAEARP